jgi:hypothetical protein
MSDVVPRCLNCGAELGGPFCQSCGQKAASVHLGFHAVLHEVTHEFLHLDGKIFRTLKLLITRPGQLTKDLVEGHRARHITPLRLYLTASILFFFLFTALPGGGASSFNVTYTNESNSGFRIGPRSEAEQAAADPVTRDQISGRVLTNLPRAVFVVMPISALLTFAFYRRRQPFYVARLYYAVHVHTFAFLAGSIVLLLSRGGRVVEIVALPVALSTFVYHYLALHRFFGDSWPRTLWKGTVITFMYVVLLIVAMGLLLWLALTGFEGGWGPEQKRV